MGESSHFSSQLSIQFIVHYLAKGLQFTSWFTAHYSVYFMVYYSSQCSQFASPASLRCGPWARHIYHSLVLVQPRKTGPYITERFLIGRKESNQTNYSVHGEMDSERWTMNWIVKWIFNRTLNQTEKWTIYWIVYCEHRELKSRLWTVNHELVMSESWILFYRIRRPIRYLHYDEWPKQIWWTNGLWCYILWLYFRNVPLWYWACTDEQLDVHTRDKGATSYVHGRSWKGS